jgi:hypothetical protein
LTALGSGGNSSSSFLASVKLSLSFLTSSHNLLSKYSKAVSSSLIPKDLSSSSSKPCSNGLIISK